MFREKTVFVLGAGSSRPYGFPTSGELRTLILGGDPAVTAMRRLEWPEGLFPQLESTAIECAFQDSKRLAEFRKVFRDAQRVSIDAFIGGRGNADNAGSFGSIAKNLIASIILLAEHLSPLDGDWYQWLLEFLIAEGTDFPSGILSVVTFNYDRSLEYYLWRAFQNSFALSDEQALKMLQKIEFVHVYGSTGPLSLPGAAGIKWGQNSKWQKAAEFIELVAPRSPPETQVRVRTLIDQTARIVFIGFGFWRENMEVLKDPTSAWLEKHIYASCRGLWKTTQSEADARIGNQIIGGASYGSVIWGAPEETALQFVTRANLSSATFNRPALFL